MSKKSKKSVMCIIPSEWGQKVRVAGELLDIPADGSAMEVPAEAADALLANPAKWRDPNDLPGTSAQAMKSAGKPILVDGQGFELSEEEADQALADAGGDDATWPEVSTSNTKDELLAVVTDLGAAHPELADVLIADGTKAEIVAGIDAAYDALGS